MAKEKKDKGLLSISVLDFIEATAAREPTPGGGAVAGVVGCLAVALGQMALGFTRGKTKFAQHEDFYARLAGRLQRARQMFEALVAEDVQAYRLCQESARLTDGPDKSQAVQLALAAAIDVPREMAKLALAVLEDMAALVERCNPNLISDLEGSAALAAAVLRLCDYNVQVNIAHLAETDAARDILRGSQADVALSRTILQRIEQAAQQKC